MSKRNIFSATVKEIKQLHELFGCSSQKKRKRKKQQKRVYPVPLIDMKKAPDFTGNGGEYYFKN